MLRLKTSEAGFEQAFRRLVQDRRESDENVSRDVSLILADVRQRGDAALAELTRAVAALDNTELRVIRFADGEKDAGSLALTALAEAMAAELEPVGAFFERLAPRVLHPGQHKRLSFTCLPD